MLADQDCCETHPGPTRPASSDCTPLPRRPPTADDLDWPPRTRRPVAMFYAARGSIPPKRHTQHRAPDGSLYAEELFGVEGFTGRSSLLYHVTPPTRTHRIEPRRGDPPRGGRRRLSPPPADRRGRGRAARRRGHRPDPAVLQQRHRDGRRPPGRADGRDGLLPQRRGRRAAVRPRGRGPARHDLRADPLRPGRLPRPADRDDLAARAGRRQRQRMLYLECPSEIEPPKRYRNDYGQLLEHSPYSQRDIRAARRGPGRGPTRASSGSTSRCATG